ncbi:MAG: ADP-ribosylglycohydrolase family protein [Porticoccaceae bacterium]|nr:ADP-ribosylglycohydrolase family protein [Porticoccaceae bacterium]MBT7564025.1 ADP-ribosylglycohydrolase family protein [Porticoccaceae bacterium]
MRMISRPSIMLISLLTSSISFGELEGNRQVSKISRSEYMQQLQGFWLGQNIANWTGLITEMDKVGTPQTLPFYTDEDWGKPDLKAIWGEFVPHSSTIDFYFELSGTPWGADDDTDIEYMYAHLHDQLKTSKLSANQIRDGWLHHIYSEEDAPLFQNFPTSNPIVENFLWVSNEQARKLMQAGMSPPETSEPANNSNYMMIDAQLTTEIFGLLAPARPDVAIDIAYLPVRTTAMGDAQWISQFYIAMHSLASVVDKSETLANQTLWLAEQASSYLPPNSTPAKMYAFIKEHYLNNPNKDDWESTRDAIYHRYQLERTDGYVYREPFDGGINFAASLVSLFYGEGNIARTIQIGSLAGWDSDNPTATWGGLLGFIIGPQGIAEAFSQSNLSDTYWIHRTRRNFPDKTQDALGEDSFSKMAGREMRTVDRVVVQRMKGSITTDGQYWVIPIH